MEVIMKKIIIAITIAAAAILTACHEPQFIESNADRQGITSLSVIFTSGKYADMEMTRYLIPEEAYEEGYFDIPIPWYYPETSDDVTKDYMFELKVQAELQPNFKISPQLGILDLTEEHKYTLTDPKGNTRPIIIAAHRAHSSNAELVSFMINDMMMSCIIYKDKKEILVPYLGDLSSVSVSGQVSPHATLAKISGKTYNAGGKYNLNTGATVSVLADDQKTMVEYSVRQGLPDKIDMGLSPASVAPLFNIDPVTMVGLPAFNEKAYVSLAYLENTLVVSTGNGTAPMCLNCFTGAKTGTVNLGSAVADVITNDEAEHMLIANCAQGGDSREDVNIYVTSSVKTAPTLLGSFTNPIDVPIGHRMKVIGDVTKDALITFTAEGIDGVTTTAKAVYVKVSAGAIAGDPVVVDFAGLGLSWGSAPVSVATVVPASLAPEHDGWFLDYYGENSDADGNYLLHYIDAKSHDNIVARIGNWANNPNCLDIKTFNNARYMTLFVVSHFPCWGSGPMLYLFDVTSADSASLQFSNTGIKWFQDGTYDGEVGASGDVVLAPTADGYRMYVYYYDHHSQAIGAYVSDCIKI